jgi:CDP-glucose 4,6-dehydratase
MISKINICKSFNKKIVLVTGHTGFKGSWLSFILSIFGAKVIGISLKDNYKRSMINYLYGRQIVHKEFFFNICDNVKLKKVLIKYKPNFIFHLAAQSLVKTGFDDPLKTWNSNLIGTVNILNNLRFMRKIVAVIVTSDKCYKNVETYRGYKESDILFGSDPYSASKSSAEIAFKSFCESFLNKKTHRVASARAGNVVGGGDFSENRLIPDIYKAVFLKKKLKIRSIKSTRPWQHVLEPVFGYMTLAYNLRSDKNTSHNSYNFGPSKNSQYSVKNVLQYIKIFWKFKITKNRKLIKIKESKLLHLNSTKALRVLGWKTCLNFRQTLQYTIDWYNEYKNNKKNIYNFTEKQIMHYLKKDN